jgi:hypothetical protein
VLGAVRHAIISTKGVSTTAARQLLDQLSQRVDKILVLHDFDISGFTILGTLASDSRRYRFGNKFAMIDIGLRLAAAGPYLGSAVLRSRGGKAAPRAPRGPHRV